MAWNERAIASMLATTVFGIVACSTSGSSTPAQTFSTSAAVSGVHDAHCTGKPAQATNEASCHPDAAAVPDPGDAGVEPYGDTMFGSEGDDDDCKYHVAWASTPIAKDTDVTLEITTTRKTDSQPAVGAKPRLEVFLNDTHPAPSTKQTATEISAGKYDVGPIRFDASGQWTVRVHLYQDCEDLLDDSPHGHAAFYLNVP